MCAIIIDKYHMLIKKDSQTPLYGLTSLIKPYENYPYK